MARPAAQTKARITVFGADRPGVRNDKLATEEPLEIRVIVGGQSRTVAISMRTPGADFELAVGFLHAEGVIDGPSDVRKISYCGDTDLPEEQLYNIVIVELDPALRPDLRSLDRNFFTTSACGVCGKASLEALSLKGAQPIPEGTEISAGTINRLPHALREAQGLFESTGGLHAAGLFDVDGTLIKVREDVGRHNAVDKLIGWALLEHRLPLDGHVVMVSGRSSFEIVQKCLVARVPIVCSVSAPSSLAMDVAREFGMTLLGFVRDDRFNAYAGAERVI